MQYDSRLPDTMSISAVEKSCQSNRLACQYVTNLEVLPPDPPSAPRASVFVAGVLADDPFGAFNHTKPLIFFTCARTRVCAFAVSLCTSACVTAHEPACLPACVRVYTCVPA